MLFLVSLMKASIILMLSTSTVLAEMHLIEMRNADPNDPNSLNVFTPNILHIEKGDSIRFVMIEKGHNSASKRGMIPEGAESWNGAIDEEIEVVFDVEGTYGYLCLPHYEMGMVGLILVGDYNVNFKKAKKIRHVGKAKKAFRNLFKRVESETLKGEKIQHDDVVNKSKRAETAVGNTDGAHKH